MSNLEFGPFGGGNTIVLQNIGPGQLIAADTDTTLTLNTEVRSRSFGTSFGSNQITLADGDYDIYIQGSWRHSESLSAVPVKAYLYDVTNTVEKGGVTRVFSEKDGESQVAVNFEAILSTGPIVSSLFDFRLRSFDTLTAVDAGGSINNYQLQVKIVRVGYLWNI